MEYIKRVPVALSGVMLGTLALGNLLQSYSETIRYVCGLMALFLLLLLLLKLLLFPAAVGEELKTAVGAGVSATFPMSLMLFSVYGKPWLGAGAQILWYFAIFLHLLLILYFTWRFVLHFEWKNVFTVWYIVYVGIVVSSLTAPAYERTDIGSAAFWFGFAALLILLVLVSIRYRKFPDLPEPARPLLMIYAAPAALCTAGYIQSVTPKSAAFVTALCLFSNLIYLFALSKAVSYLKLPFYPSYAAFTFPFAITAIASKQSMNCLAKLGSPLPALQPVVLVETAIAVCLLLYSYIRFLLFIFGAKKS